MGGLAGCSILLVFIYFLMCLVGGVDAQHRFAVGLVDMIVGAHSPIEERIPGIEIRRTPPDKLLEVHPAFRARQSLEIGFKPRRFVIHRKRRQCARVQFLPLDRSPYGLGHPLEAPMVDGLICYHRCRIWNRSRLVCRRHLACHMPSWDGLCQPHVLFGFVSIPPWVSFPVRAKRLKPLQKAAGNHTPCITNLLVGAISHVAQTSSLLYRRLPVGRCVIILAQKATPSACGLEIRDTADWKSALQWR
ncbi:MAG: hypothetical protein QOF48_2581 [Verrucomicrobiota bacterium]